MEEQLLLLCRSEASATVDVRPFARFNISAKRPQGGRGRWGGEGSVGDLEGLKLPQWYVQVEGVAFCLEKKRLCICE